MIPTHLIIHHSASDSGLTFEQIRANHLERGWSDIGYHYVIDVAGCTFKGRPDSVVGAHALGINQTSLGICCIGNFEIEQPPAIQFEVLVELVKKLSAQFNISRDAIQGHCDITCAEREYRKSSCPGKFLYQRLGEIRDLVS